MKSGVSREEVKLAYQLLLGREAENEKVIEDHLTFGTLAELRNAFLSSAEFQGKMRTILRPSVSKWVAVDVLDRYTQWVDLHDCYVSQGCLANNWEPNETAYFVSNLNEGDTVLDIGANIGWFTLVAAKQAGKKGRIHSFEPRPETARMLKRTISDNDLEDQVTVWEFALMDSRRTVNLVWEKQGGNPGHSFVSENPRAVPGAVDSAKIGAAPLDELLPDVAPDLIKIDIEGAEPLAVRGAQNAISRKKPPILSEIYPDQLRRVSGTSPAQYIEQMERFGYKCYLLHDGKPTKRIRDYPSDATAELVSVVFECGRSPN